jgi:hypothetical protein
MGFAFGADNAVSPARDISLADIADYYGFGRCYEGVSALDCKAQCGKSDYIMIYIYSQGEIVTEDQKGKLTGSFTSKSIDWPNAPNKHKIDIHALKGDDGKQCKYHSQIGAYEKGSEKDTTQSGGTPFVPTAREPDFFSPTRILAKVCCCNNFTDILKALGHGIW